MYWKRLPKLSKTVNHLLSLFALSLIIFTSVSLTKASQFPGLNAFWPCLGATLLIVTGKDQDDAGIVNRFLSLSPVIFIGLISYSLYLWHWPVLVFIRYLEIDFTDEIRILAIVFIFLISWLSWKFVELPFHRQIKWSFRQTMLRIMLTSFVVITAIYAAIDHNDGYPERFSRFLEFDKGENFPNRVRRACFNQYIVGNIEQCSLGLRKERLDGLLIGDSFANHSAAFLDVLASDAGLFIHDSTAAYYPLLASRLENGDHQKPQEYGIERLRYARQFDNIFIAANWSLHRSPGDANYEPILETIGELIAEGKNVIIFTGLRSTTKDNLHRLKLFKTRDSVFFETRDFSIPYTERPQNHIINEMKRRYPSIIFIDIDKILCDEVRCNIELDGELIYRNENHITTNGGTRIGELYLERFGNPLSQLSGARKHQIRQPEPGSD